jgi:SAM-dependent methyltransferase
VDRLAWQARGRSFGPAAERYDRIRPSYPIAALRWILGETPARVVDLGAGTGILSRQLIELGHEVIAVEPDIEMLHRLRSVSPGAFAVAGLAEAIPLRTASVDAVVAGQAYHWFDWPRANAEAARVLKPGGVFAAMWNDRDESVGWLASLSEIADDLANRRAEEHRRLYANPDFGPGLQDAAQERFRHATRHTPDSLVELMKSRSYYLMSPPDRQTGIEAAIRELLATHPELAARTEFELPYVTVAYRARRV